MARFHAKPLPNVLAGPHHLRLHLRRVDFGETRMGHRVRADGAERMTRHIGKTCPIETGTIDNIYRIQPRLCCERASRQTQIGLVKCTKFPIQNIESFGIY